MSASTHDHPELGPAEVVEVADRVFAYIQPDGSWYINNTGFVVGDRQVISIDACSTERRTRAFRDAITSVTAAPVGMLVNTHHHGDHHRGKRGGNRHDGWQYACRGGYPNPDRTADLHKPECLALQFLYCGR